MPPATLWLLQIRRVKSLSEPPINRRQQVVGVLAPALLLPQAGEAHGGAEFQGFGVLVAGDVEGFVETGFGLVFIWDSQFQ
jgi:hypothetical protein